MSNSKKKLDVRPWDASLFDCTDVTWEIEDSKRNDRIKIVLFSDTPFNTLKVYLSLKMICEKIEMELNIMDECEGEH